ncbi:alpha/beta hydrolase [Mucilaginibacter sp.]
MHITENQLHLPSSYLQRDVTCTILGTEGVLPENLLLLNDGQEIESLNLKASLQYQYERKGIAPLLVVAIGAGEERIQEYGIAGQPDYKQRGTKADSYNRFVVEELFPAIALQAPVEEFKIKAFAGFSLGGLSALDIAWHNDDLFNKVGVFSGSLWWRSKGLADGYTNDDRLIHRVIRESAGKPDLKFWLQTGTKDELADRNHNGIIDSIDDTIDLIKELESKGYTRPNDVQYLEIVGGEHNTGTWAEAMPKFLCWAFGN